MTGVVCHPRGPRVYVGLRVHHGSAGCAIALIAIARRRPRLAALAAVMIAHDAGDFPWRDRDNHGA